MFGLGQQNPSHPAWEVCTVARCLARASAASRQNAIPGKCPCAARAPGYAATHSRVARRLRELPKSPAGTVCEASAPLPWSAHGLPPQQTGVLTIRGAGGSGIRSGAQQWEFALTDSSLGASFKTTQDRSSAGRAGVLFLAPHSWLRGRRWRFGCHKPCFT